jgi:hypothetical protein
VVLEPHMDLKGIRGEQLVWPSPAVNLGSGSPRTGPTWFYNTYMPWRKYRRQRSQSNGRGVLYHGCPVNFLGSNPKVQLFLSHRGRATLASFDVYLYSGWPDCGVERPVLKAAMTSNWFRSEKLCRLSSSTQPSWRTLARAH